MNKTRYLALFAIAYLICILLVTAPASLLAPIIQRISHDKLSLANCQGTLWHGSATPLLRSDTNSSVAFHTLHWKIRPLTMLRGQLSAEMNWDDLQTAAGMTLLAYRHAIVLNNLHLPLPIEVIGELSPFLKPAQFSGNLLLESPQLTFIDNHLQGSATAHWNQAGSAMSAVHPLGDYQIEMTANQNSLSATLSTRAGVLQLSGQGNWSPAQKFHFNGTASATPESNGALTELLHHLGPELSPGVYRIFL